MPATMNVHYGTPRTIAPGVTLEGSCTVNGRSTWGFRLTCDGCGEVDASPVSSSVASEDHPPRFAREHRACNPEYAPARVELRPMIHGRPDRAHASFLYFDARSIRHACEQARAHLAATCSPLQIIGATFDH